MLARDHYATLGVPPNATDDEIDDAYRHLSRRYHPDINPGDPHAAAVYERLESAYRVLSDPTRRARYDAEGMPKELEAAAGPDLSVRLIPAADDDASYQDLFRLLRDHAQRAGAQQGGPRATCRCPAGRGHLRHRRCPSTAGGARSTGPNHRAAARRMPRLPRPRPRATGALPTLRALRRRGRGELRQRFALRYLWMRRVRRHRPGDRPAV